MGTVQNSAWSYCNWLKSLFLRFVTNEQITNLTSFWTQFIQSLSLIMIGVWTWRLHQKTCQRDGWAARSLLKTLNLLLPTVKTFVSRLNLPSEFQIPRPGILYEIFSILQNSLFQKCKKNVILIYVFSNSLLRILALEFLWIHHI